MMKTMHLMLFNHVAAILLPRGVTRLDDARGKKQVWRPMFEPELFRKQI